MNANQNVALSVRLKSAIAAIILAALCGCATCERHPVACGVGSAILIGSLTATVNGIDRRRAAEPITTHVLCERGVTACGL
jgi:hypothetical protein